MLDILHPSLFKNTMTAHFFCLGSIIYSQYKRRSIAIEEELLYHHNLCKLLLVPENEESADARNALSSDTIQLRGISSLRGHRPASQRLSGSPADTPAAVRLSSSPPKRLSSWADVITHRHGASASLLSSRQLFCVRLSSPPSGAASQLG